MSTLYSGDTIASSTEIIAIPDTLAIGFSYCRFCAQIKPFLELLDLTVEVTTFQRCLTIISDLKIDYLDLSAQNNLPKSTCNDCFNSLVSAHSFLETVKQNQEYLKNVYPEIKSESSCQIKIEQDCLLIKNDFISPNCSTFKPKTVSVNYKNYSDHEYYSGFDNSNSPEDQDISVFAEEVEDEISLDILNKQDIKVLKVTPLGEFKSEDKAIKSLATNSGVPVFVKDDIDGVQAETESWKTYMWFCLHCKGQFENIEELRGHSKEDHKICYAFNCVDCASPFNTFNAFIEHVKEHRVYLRRHCQYCNEKFPTNDDCSEHIWNTHWGGDQKICELCGEVLPNNRALERHKALYKKHKLDRRILKRKPRKIPSLRRDSGDDRSWINYDWTCQDCCRSMQDADSLRAHTRDVHNKCFSMKCMDCLKVMTNFRSFVDHASRHRPYLKNYCQYCNVYYKDIRESLRRHIQTHLDGPKKPCDGCGQIFEDNELLNVHMKQYEAPRRRGTLTQEDLVCDICNKQLTTIGTLRKHRKTHEANRIREYTCDVCGKAFFTQYVLNDHMKSHVESKDEVCKICSKVFRTKTKLKNHVETHMDYKPFTCDTCGKCFRRKGRLQSHIVMQHSGKMRYKCIACGKQFRTNGNLKTHERQHTGIRPFACEYCEKTFTNWANCNKHMIRRHGVTLAKTKLTPQGRIEINRRTGKPKNLPTDDSTKEWIEGILKNGRPGRKT